MQTTIEELLQIIGAQRVENAQLERELVIARERIRQLEERTENAPVPLRGEGAANG